MKILGIEITTCTFSEAIALVQNRIQERAGGYVCFVNVHSITEASDDPALQQVFLDAWTCFPDGKPIAWVASLQLGRSQPRVCGPDFMQATLEHFPDVHHAFVGGKPGQALSIAQKFGLTQWTSYCPPVRSFSPEAATSDWAETLNTARTSNYGQPQYVWVGLGAPKQERWMQAVSRMAPHSVFLGVGAAFDFLAGDLARAPAWMRSNGLEWLYRMCQQPRRLGPRYLRTNFLFVYKIVREILMRKKLPSK